MADSILGWLGDALGLNKGVATQNAADANKSIIKNYGKTGQQTIDTGTDQAGGYLKQILGLTGMGNGSTLYADALGTNGADGSQRAQDAFTSSPGYQFQMDQGLQALDRRNAAAGGYQSGGANLDTLDYSQGLANQDWNTWLGNLTGGVDRASGALSGLAGLSTNSAAAKLGVQGDVASGLTSANSQGAAGAEAGQGGLWTTLNNIAGVAGSAFGLKPPGAPAGGGVAGAGGAAGGVAPVATPTFGGYGLRFG